MTPFRSALIFRDILLENVLQTFQLVIIWEMFWEKEGTNHIKFKRKIRLINLTGSSNLFHPIDSPALVYWLVYWFLSSVRFGSSESDQNIELGFSEYSSKLLVGEKNLFMRRTEFTSINSYFYCKNFKAILIVIRHNKKWFDVAN